MISEPCERTPRRVNTLIYTWNGKKAGLTQVRVHDLRHTYGRRSAGVSFENRQDLLGHKSKRITTHYSRAEIKNLIEASEKACTEPGNPHKISTLVVLRGQVDELYT